MLIRSKLILWFTLLVASILIVFSYSVYYFYSQYRSEEFFERLHDKATITAKLFLEGDHVNLSLAKYIHPGDLNSLSNEKVTMYDESGKPIYASSKEPDVIPFTSAVRDTILKNKKVSLTSNETSVQGILYQDEKTSFIVVASAYDRYGIDHLDNMKLILVIANIVAIIAVLFIGWIYAGKVLSPISEVIDQVSQITYTNLDARVDEGNRKDEIAQLAITFNRMLDRINNTFEVQKSFVSHASHELRTPLANISGTLETSYYYDDNLEESKKSIYSSMEEINKLIRLVNGLLSLAKIENSKAIPFIKLFPIDELILQSVSDLKKKYPDQQIGFSFGYLCDDYNDFKILGNEELLQTAIINVIENACKFSKGSKIVITLEIFTSHELTINVKDNGFGIDPADLKFIFEPLYRGSNTHHIAGFGIGLALVQRIVKLHKGEIFIESEPNKGTSVVIVLPLAVSQLFQF